MSCPAGRRYEIGVWFSPRLKPYYSEWWQSKWDSEPCNICTGFIGLSFVDHECPCDQLGEDDAIGRTTMRLGEVGNG